MWKQEASPKTEGTRQAQTANPATAGRLVDEERRVVAWIGKSVVFKGDLSSSEDMMIDGRLEGTVELRDYGLTIGPNAQIRADIVAKTVIVRGSVTGTVTAGDKVVVSETGSVEGDIISPRLALVGLIRFRGHLPKGGYDVPNGQHDEKPAAAPAV
jgi:cytoskeletal protein CcmA (bactofilin family)